MRKRTLYSAQAPRSFLVPPRVEQRGDGTPETCPFLPRIQCIGHFTSDPTTSDGIYRSSLTVVWFQRTFAPPVDPEVEEKIANVIGIVLPKLQSVGMRHAVRVLSSLTATVSTSPAGLQAVNRRVLSDNSVR